LVDDRGHQPEKIDDLTTGNIGVLRLKTISKPPQACSTPGGMLPSVPEKDPLPAIPRQAHRTSYTTQWRISSGGFNWGVNGFEVHLCITGASRGMVKASGRNPLFCLRVYRHESGVSVVVMSTISPRRALVALLIMTMSMPIALDFVLRIGSLLTANVPIRNFEITKLALDILCNAVK